MQTINLHIYEKNIIPALYTKQGDVGRKFKAVIADGIPDGVTFSVWYSGASGAGNYTHIGDRSAFAVEGSTVTVELITQMLTNAGPGKLCLVMSGADGSQLATWNIPYEVEHVPGMGSAAAEQYYTAFSEAVKNLPYPDVSLTAAGKAADAAAVGAALAGKAPAVESDDYPGCYYRTVNGVVEWLNPPMVLGMKYRTTERWQGKPVYTMLVDCGGMVNGKRVDVDVEHTDILRHAATMGKNSLPLINYETYVSAQHVGQTAIAILMYSGSESFQGMATYTQIWYTKD